MNTRTGVMTITCALAVGPLLAGQPETTRTSFAPARSLLVQKGVPFDPHLLLEKDWRTRLRPVLDSMPELRTERHVTGPLKGAYLAGTLVLPEKVFALGDVVILARRVVFLGPEAVILAPGHSVAVFPLERTYNAGRDEKLGKGTRLAIYTGSLRNGPAAEAERLRELVAELCPSALEGCEEIHNGVDGASGADGAPGADGNDGTAGGNGRNGSCQGTRDGETGHEGEWGREGHRGEDGAQGGLGGPGQAIHVALGSEPGPCLFSAAGGQGGRGGSGGNGGNGGSGGQAGRGGRGASCNDCGSGSGGNGGAGGDGGTAGSGGTGGAGGNGGNGNTISVSHCNTPVIIADANGGNGGQGGGGGLSGTPGGGTAGGQGGNGGFACGYTAPGGEAGGFGNNGAHGSFGTPGYNGTSGNAGSVSITAGVGCDSGGGGCDAPNAKADCCSDSDRQACQQDPACFWIYGTCECWCPYERPGR